MKKLEVLAAIFQDMNKIKNTILLAGGDGTRFWPLSDKNQFNFLGKPLFIQQLLGLEDFTEFVTVIVNKENKELFDRQINVFGLEKFARTIVQENLEHGQAGALLTVKDKIKGAVLVVNANDVFDFSVLERFDQTHAVIILAKTVEKYFPGGYLQLETDRPVKIIEKPLPKEVPSNKVKLVCDYFLNFDELINIISQTSSPNDDLYEVAVNQLLNKHKNTTCLLLNSSWTSLKYPWEVLNMTQVFLKNVKNTLDQSTIISPTAVVTGNVFFGKNVKVGDFAKIVGPCFIGDRTIVGDYSLVRSSHIGTDCLIGAYSEVARSHLGNNISLHRNYVGDSVLSDGVLFGSGATTANFRFDKAIIASLVNNKKILTNLDKFGAIIGNGAKIGVNSSILPGIKIGKNTFIGPQSLIQSDVEDNIYLFNGAKVPNIRVEL